MNSLSRRTGLLSRACRSGCYDARERKDLVDLLDKLFCVRVTGLRRDETRGGWAEVKRGGCSRPRVMENESLCSSWCRAEAAAAEFVKRISIYIFRSGGEFGDVSDTREVKVAGVMGRPNDGSLKAAFSRPRRARVPPCLWTTARANGAIANRVMIRRRNRPRL